MIIFLLALIGSASAFSPSATGPRGGVSRPAIIIMAEMDPVKAKIAAAKAAKAAKAAGSTAAEPVAAKVANEPEAAQAAEPAVAVAIETNTVALQPNINSMPGKYSLKPLVFDPLGLANRYDLNWLREAELKHGRVTMLAVVGWLAVDAGIKFPGAAFEGVNALEAHDAMVKSGHMWALLAVVGTCEALHMSVVVPRLDGDWSGYEPGNYGLDPFSWASDKTREAELKHGRLAMLAFGGLVTQAGLGSSSFPYA